MNRELAKLYLRLLSVKPDENGNFWFKWADRTDLKPRMVRGECFFPAANLVPVDPKELGEKADLP